MNVLIINGSPKGNQSNTMKLVHAFLNGMGYENIDIINAANTEIKPCLGCFSCWNKTPGTCAIQDEMDIILSKLISADVVIWAFPLYFFSVPGALKNIIDRQLPLSLPFMETESEGGGHPPRYDLSKQRHVIISTCGFWTSQGNYDAVIAMFDHYYGSGNYLKIMCGQGELFSVPELKNRVSLYLKTVQQAGMEFVKGNISIQTQTRLDTPLYPRDAFEKMADASWGVTDDSTERLDESLVLTKQMAALYKPDGKNRVLEFYYDDVEKSYQVLLTPQGSKVITDDFKEYTTRIETPLSVWRAIARGEISGQESLFKRQYKVLGDFEIMLHWDELFNMTSTFEPEVETLKREPNMLLFLLPWIVFWISASTNTTPSVIAGISIATILPLLWHIFRPVIFEQISIPIVTGLSLAILLGTKTHIVIPVSYFIFGFMWFISTFAKKPLTAYYSASKYGKEKAMSNPLFVRTNRILTATWGILYLIMAIWTYYLMNTALSVYIIWINSVCTALLGVFTAWFQKWYPAHWTK